MTHIMLHVGVHKTATTHMQASLRLSRARLNAASVSYWDPKTLRAGGSDVADYLRLAEGRFASGVQQMLGGHDRLLISEENMLRLPYKMGEGPNPVLYERGHELIAQMGQGAPEQQVDVAISLRDYAGYFRSLYTQTLMGGYFPSFERFITRSSYDVCTWVDLVDRIHALPNVRRIMVWRYEDYGVLAQRIFAGLIGQDLGAIPLVPERSHPGLSEQAVTALREHQARDPGHNRRLHKIPRRPIAQAARDAFPTGAQYPKFDPWQAADLEMSAQRYAADMAEIAAMPKVHLLKA